VRIGVQSLGLIPMEATAFLRPDGRVVLVVLNRDYGSGRTFFFHDPNRGFANIVVPAASIVTIMYRT
jgi:hypothetical protein